MIFSLEQIFSDGQVVDSTQVSTNVIDLGATGTVVGAPAAMVRDIGKGRPIPIVIQIDADAVGTTPTLDVDIEVDDNESFTSATVVASSQQVGDVSAGHRVALFYVPEGTNERYMRLSYTLGGSGSPQYTVTAGIVLADQTAPM